MSAKTKQQISFSKMKHHSRRASSLAWFVFALGHLVYFERAFDDFKAITFFITGFFASRFAVSYVSFYMKRLLFGFVPFSRLGTKLLKPLVKKIPIHEKVAATVNYFSYLLIIVDIVVVYMFCQWFYGIFY
jgi:hypothetical protein